MLKWGESRLFERAGTWYLLVTATREVEDKSEASTNEQTPIGVDIGEASFVTVCHREKHGSPVRHELWTDDGKTVRRLRKTYFTSKQRLQKSGSKRIAADSTFDIVELERMHFGVTPIRPFVRGILRKRA